MLVQYHINPIIIIIIALFSIQSISIIIPFIIIIN